jgi:hypothetical protein
VEGQGGEGRRRGKGREREGKEERKGEEGGKRKNERKGEEGEGGGREGALFSTLVVHCSLWCSITFAIPTLE